MERKEGTLLPQRVNRKEVGEWHLRKGREKTIRNEKKKNPHSADAKGSCVRVAALKLQPVGRGAFWDLFSEGTNAGEGG